MYEVRQLAHTADLGIAVEASGPEELFRGAADGLRRLLLGEDRRGFRRTAGPPPEDGEGEELVLERPDPERLLVDWLRELLWRATRDGRLPADVRVRLPDRGRLVARIWWDPGVGARQVTREIKGVTYHGLKLREDAGGWHARVVFDV